MTLFSLEASRNYANHTQPPVSDSAKKMNAIYGQRCSEQYERLSQPTSWAKMFVGCLIGMEAWYSMRCVLTWKILGIKSRPVLFLRSVSMPHINENEYGLLRTPTAEGDAGKRGLGKMTCQDAKMKNRTISLTRQIRDWSNGQLSGLLPTPSASDIQGAPKRAETITQNESGGWTRTADGTGTKFGAKLMDVAQMLPTPTAQVVKHGHSEKYWNNRIGKRQMDIAMWNAQTNGTTSQLNPRFVLEMMGFPPDWTELPFLNGETNLSKPEETP